MVHARSEHGASSRDCGITCLTRVSVTVSLSVAGCIESWNASTAATVQYMLCCTNYGSTGNLIWAAISDLGNPRGRLCAYWRGVVKSWTVVRSSTCAVHWVKVGTDKVRTLYRVRSVRPVRPARLSSPFVVSCPGLITRQWSLLLFQFLCYQSQMLSATASRFLPHTGCRANAGLII